MSTRDDPERERLYERLALAPNATQAEITAAYRRLVLAFHPDTAAADAADPDALQHVIAAHRVLSDPEQRRAYDEHNNRAEISEAPPPRARHCGVCRGTGHIELPCPECGGSGRQHTYMPWLQRAYACNACAGRRTRRTRCGACAGTGTQ
jgi:DnaJ-class molecular chaperone